MRDSRVHTVGAGTIDLGIVYQYVDVVFLLTAHDDVVGHTAAANERDIGNFVREGHRSICRLDLFTADIFEGRTLYCYRLYVDLCGTKQRDGE